MQLFLHCIHFCENVFRLVKKPLYSGMLNLKKTVTNSERWRDLSTLLISTIISLSLVTFSALQ